MVLGNHLCFISFLLAYHQIALLAYHLIFHPTKFGVKSSVLFLVWSAHFSPCGASFEHCPEVLTGYTKFLVHTATFGGDLTQIFRSLETTTARILWGPIKGHRILQEEDFDVSQDPLKNPKRKV
jgi:hypothetical protein